MAILLWLLAIYLIYGSYLIWKDFNIKNPADMPLYVLERKNIFSIILAAIVLPCSNLSYGIRSFIAEGKRNKEKGIQEHNMHREHEVKEEERARKDIERIKLFEKNIKNINLINKAGGCKLIEGNNIGQVIINKNEKTVLIEIKQCPTLQPINYFEGHLLCKNADYEILETNINGAVFVFHENEDATRKYELQANHNRQGVIIKCSEVELIDYKRINVAIEEFKDLYIGCLWGKYFKILEDGR